MKEDILFSGNGQKAAVYQKSDGLANAVAKVLPIIAYPFGAVLDALGLISGRLQSIGRLFISAVRLHGAHVGPLCRVGKGVRLGGKKYMSLGERVSLGPYSRVECITRWADYTYNPNLVMGDHVTINWFCHIGCAERVEIGSDTHFGNGVLVTDHNHAFHGSDLLGVSALKTPLEVKPVRIGSRCFLGEHVIVLPGVTIGDDCVIGAGTIVTRDIPPCSIVVGVPGKVVGVRHQKEEVTT